MSEVGKSTHEVLVTSAMELSTCADPLHPDRCTSAQHQADCLSGTSITTHNVHSVRLHMQKILATRPYIYMVQEANVAEAEVAMTKAQASEAGYTVVFSAPTPLASDGRSRVGRRLAIFVRMPGIPAVLATADDKSCAYLLHSGRWMECFVPTTDGSKHQGAANLYGYAGASTDDQLRKLNELLLLKLLTAEWPRSMMSRTTWAWT